MYDLDTLVTDGVVRASATLFPVDITIGSNGISPTRFTLAQVPGTDADPEWVACAWQGNPTGGTPILILASKVDRVLAFSPSKIVVLIEGGTHVSVGASAGCGCGNVLKNYRGWAGSQLVGVPSPKINAA